MNVVDSCGWLEYFAGGSNADFFASPIESDDDALVVPTLCLYEVFKAVLRQFGREQAVEKVAVMKQSIVVPLDDGLALDAATVSLRLGLPMADSVILSTARHCGATLWTQDVDFENIEGIRYRKKQG